MEPTTKLIVIVVSVVSGLLLSTAVLGIALGVGLGVGLNDDSSSSNGGGGSNGPDPYVLSDTAIVFGALTPAGRGGVRLSAQDSHQFAASYRGLGLLPETSYLPAFWRITPINNISSSHWTFVTGLVIEGRNATTPVPSAAGAAADLNQGPYSFLIEAFTVDSKPYKSAYLTITIQPNALNLGTYDSTSQLLGPSVTAGSWAGDTILLSTGIDRTGVTTPFLGFLFSRTVTIRHADASRPGGIVSLSFSSSSNIVVTGISFTGDLTAFYVPAPLSFGGGSTNMVARSCNATFGPMTAGIRPAILFGGCTNCMVIDFYAFGMDSGVVDDQDSLNENIIVERFRMRQFYNNAIWVGNAKNISFIDCTTIAAMRYTDKHLDHIQIADGASPQGLQVIRHQMYKAEGNGGAQGFFGGTPGIYQGYIDDNSTFPSYSNKAGNVLTITNVSLAKPVVRYTWLRGTNFPELIRVTAVPPGGAIVGQYVIDHTINAAPGRIHTAPFNDLTISGLTYTGWMRNVLYLRGMGGRTTIKAYTASMVNTIPSDVPWSYFMGTITGGSTLTVTEFQSGIPINVPMFIEMADGTKLTGTGRALVDGYGTGKGGVGTYELEGSGFSYPTVIALRGTSDPPNQQNQGPACDILGVDIPTLYPAETSISSVYMWTSANGQPSYRAYLPGGSGAKPSTINVDSASTVFNRHNSTVASLCFAGGDPQFGPQGLQNVSIAEWAAMSFEEVVARHVAALTPRVGGPLTSGANDFGAFTRDGRWNDGSGKRPY